MSIAPTEQPTEGGNLLRGIRSDQFYSWYREMPFAKGQDATPPDRLVYHLNKQEAVMEDIKSIVIIGREWWGNAYGVPYFSSVVLVDGKSEVVVKRQHGGHEEYKHYAWRQLVKQLDLDVERYSSNLIEPPHSYCSRKGITFYSTVAEMSRKRDL